MPRAVKFSISMPASEFKALEAGRRKAGRTRSQYIRDALAAPGDDAGRMPKTTEAEKGPGSGAGTIGEERSAYGAPLPGGLPDISELRRRAAAAAGRFESGLSDLSVGHDRYLADPAGKGKRGRPGRCKKVGGTR